MSRRQALGVISNIQSNNHLTGQTLVPPTPALLTNNASIIRQTVYAAAAKANNINDENDPLQNLLITKTLKSANVNECDFEIFQEDVMAAGNQIESKKNDDDLLNKFIEKATSVASSKKEDEYYYDEEDEDEDEEDQDEEEDDDKENAQDEEEEGISRLNIVVEQISGTHVSSANQKSKNKQNVYSLDDSPMMLDETVKCQSLLTSHLDEEDQFGEISQHSDLNDDTDEEVLKKLESQERDNILQNCSEYRDDILKYMKKLEVENRPKPNYMKKQQDISSSMRSILVDWLVEVSEEYRLNMETLYLAVNYTDRFLSQMSVLRGKLQLVGTASMYIASKYEEISPPDISEFVYITDDTYTKKQVLRMEHLLLKVLEFRMSSPTINWFLLTYLRFIKVNTSLNLSSNSKTYQKIENLSRYIAELSLIDGDIFLNYLPSQIAVASIYLAFYTLNKPWSKQLIEICEFDPHLENPQIKECIINLHKAMEQAPTHPQQAIQEKYKQAKYDQVALIEAPKSLASCIHN